MLLNVDLIFLLKLGRSLRYKELNILSLAGVKNGLFSLEMLLGFFFGFFFLKSNQKEYLMFKQQKQSILNFSLVELPRG